MLVLVIVTSHIAMTQVFIIINFSDTDVHDEMNTKKSQVIPHSVIF